MAGDLGKIAASDLEACSKSACVGPQMQVPAAMPGEDGDGQPRMRLNYGLLITEGSPQIVIIR